MFLVTFLFYPSKDSYKSSVVWVETAISSHGFCLDPAPLISVIFLWNTFPRNVLIFVLWLPVSWPIPCLLWLGRRFWELNHCPCSGWPWHGFYFLQYFLYVPKLKKLLSNYSQEATQVRETRDSYPGHSSAHLAPWGPLCGHPTIPISHICWVSFQMFHNTGLWNLGAFFSHSAPLTSAGCVCGALLCMLTSCVCYVTLAHPGIFGGSQFWTVPLKLHYTLMHIFVWTKVFVVCESFGCVPLSRVGL